MAKALDRTLGADSPCIFIAGTGLPPNTQVFKAEVVYNMEAIVDERTLDFSTAPSIPSPSVASKADSFGNQMCGIVAAIPSSMAGDRPSEGTAVTDQQVQALSAMPTSGSGSFWSDLASGVGSVAKLAAEVVPLFLA